MAVVDSGNNVIVRAGPSSNFAIQNSSGVSKYLLVDSNGDQYLTTGTSSGIVMQTVAGVTVVSVSNAGLTTIGGSSAAPITNKVGGAAFRFGGTAEIYNQSTSGTGLAIGCPTSGTVQMAFYYNGANLVGTITTNGVSTGYNTTSDYRLKEVYDAWNSSNWIDQIKVYYGRFLGESAKGGLHPTQAFLLAHEAAEVVPHLVTGEKDAVKEDGSVAPQQLDYTGFIPMMLAELKALRSRVAELEAKQCHA
jgi:hypothetical protein